MKLLLSSCFKTHRDVRDGSLVFKVCDGLSLQLGRSTVCPWLLAQPAMDQLARSSLGLQEPQGGHGSIL